MATWQNIRVFISSTFRDMDAERDHLIKIVFPALRSRLEGYRVNLIDVDLRWGVTRAAAENDQVLGLCLEQIDECRPFLIGILGQRYGRPIGRLPTDAVLLHPWLKSHVGRSVTELEILYGALAMPQTTGSAFFYFRAPSALNEMPESIRTTVYCDSDPGAIALLHELKQRIRVSGYPIWDGYPARWDDQGHNQSARTIGRLVDLDAFGERILKDLWGAIEQRLGLRQQAVPKLAADEDALAEAMDHHEQFMESRLRAYVHREAIYGTLTNFALGNGKVPGLLVGPSGAGKSAALAAFVHRYRRDHRNVVVIPHFVGASPRSANLRETLLSLCQILQRRFGFPGELPDDTEKLANVFRGYLARVPSTTAVLLVIDALNQLEETDQARELYWFPWQPPAHVKVIASCIVGEDANSAILNAFDAHPHSVFPLEPLEDDERQGIIQRIPSLSAKTLDEQQVKLLLDNPATRNPLFLFVALEELRGFGSFEQLDARISQLPQSGDTVSAIFEQVIDRLEEEFDENLVRSVLTLIASSRRGLSERELIGLLNASYSKTGTDLFAVLRQLRPYMYLRDGLWTFFHTSLLNAIVDCYLVAPARIREAHARLADYFDKQPLELPPPHGINRRMLDELPWQLVGTGNWQRLFELLSDQQFLAHAFELSESDVMGYWAAVESNSTLSMIDAYPQKPVQSERDIRHGFLAAKLLKRTGRLSESLAFYERFTENSRAAEWHEGLTICLSSRAQILLQRGDLTEALSLYQECEQLCSQIGKVDVVAHTWGNQAVILRIQGDFDGAMHLFRRQEEHCLKTEDIDGLASSLVNQGNILATRGDIDGALRMHERAEQIYRQRGDMESLATCLGNKANALRSRGDFDEALTLRHQEESICRQIGNRLGLQLSLGNQAVLLMDKGELYAAIPLLSEEERICRQLGHLEGLQRSFGNQGIVRKEQGDLDGAMRLYEQQEQICRKLNHLDGLIPCLQNQSETFAKQHKFDAAARCVREAQQLCDKVGNLDGLADLLGSEASIQAEQGNSDGAMRLHREAEQIYRRLGNRSGLQDSLGSQAIILQLRGRGQESLGLHEEKERICRELGRMKGVAISLANQATITADIPGQSARALALAKEAYRIAVDGGMSVWVDRFEQLIERLSRIL